MRSKTFWRVSSACAFVGLAGCAANRAPAPNYDALLGEMMTASFRDQGIAKVGRLKQDTSDVECSKAEGKSLPDATAKAIETENLKTVKMPGDGKFIGDWKEGEKLAQNGRGMTWTDPSTSTSVNGGNCYNCHKIAEAEISYGTLGPSLHNYGKLRGVSDPTAPESKAIVEYTWGKLYNAKAYNACSGMPRFGHAGLLDETQLKHLMALLLDPKSPVNR